MTSTGFSIQQPILSPGFVPGAEFRISRQRFRVTRVLGVPSIAFSKGYAQGYLISCIAQKVKDPFDYFLLEIYYWTDSSIESKELQTERGKIIGDIEEPEGEAVLTLEKIGSSKNIPVGGNSNLIYIWRVEISLDPKKPLLNKQEFSEYLGKYLTPGCVITLAQGQKYRIESFLSAEGAFGTVFKALLVGTNKSVALKFQDAEPGYIEALVLREFYGHPGIVGFLGASVVMEYFNPSEEVTGKNPLAGDIVLLQQQGKQKIVRFYCVVVEYVQGKNLSQFIEEYDGSINKLYDWFDNFMGWGKSEKNLIVLGDCVSYIEQLSDAVDFIHHKGYTHLDIKPQNIMLNAENKLQIVDMGSVSKIGSRISAIGQGNHAAPEVKEFLVNRNRTSSMWLQRFVINVQSTWQVGTNIPDNLINLFRTSMTDEQKKLQQQCEIESNLAYQRISTQSDIFSVGAIFLSLISRQDPRQVALPDDNAPTKVGRIIMHEETLPLRRRSFLLSIRKAMSINVSERYQTCFGLKQAIQSEYTNLTYNEFFVSGLLLLASIASIFYYLLKVPPALAVGMFGLGVIGFIGWRIYQSMREPILSTIQLRPYTIASARLFITALIVGALFLTSEFGAFLYLERTFFIPNIQQTNVHQVEPVYYQVSPSKSTSVDELFFELGYDAYKSGNFDEAKKQFRTFLRMRQGDLGLSSTQIDAFDSSTVEQLTKFVLEKPNLDMTVEALVIMVFIEPDRIYQAKNEVDLYSSPDMQMPPSLSVPADDSIVILNHVGSLYQVWYSGALYFAQLEGIQK